jgi:chemotaxis receptor (MCP) glutamine deamidase CheD/FixJ family two-component response regulator
MINRKIRVMIIDDQALVLDILAKGLAKDPNLDIVGTATDGQLALNQIERIKPDVIVLDMEMPRMNGIQFLHELMPKNPIPTIVLSALTQKDSKITQDAFELGAVDFLPKPSGGARALPNLLIQLYTKIRIAAAQDVSHFRKIKQSMTLPSSELDRKAKTLQNILGMGAFDVTKEVGRILKIFALGSCVGVALFCPPDPTVALAHVVLPSSSTDREKAKNMPGYFADTAVGIMLQIMNENGCPNSRIVAKLAGGAKTNAEVGDYFSIGQRNAVAVKATLLKYGVKVLSDDLGGNISRTIHVTTGDKKLYLMHPEKGRWEL